MWNRMGVIGNEATVGGMERGSKAGLMCCVLFHFRRRYQFEAAWDSSLHNSPLLNK